jgi:hypothetical protein
MPTIGTTRIDSLIDGQRAIVYLVLETYYSNLQQEGKRIGGLLL